MSLARRIALAQLPFTAFGYKEPIMEQASQQPARRRVIADEPEAVEETVAMPDKVTFHVYELSPWSKELPPCSGWWDVQKNPANPREPIERLWFLRDPDGGTWLAPRPEGGTTNLGRWSAYRDTLEWRGLAQPWVEPRRRVIAE